MRSIKRRINRVLVLSLFLTGLILIFNGFYFYTGLQTLALGDEYRQILGRVNRIISLLNDYHHYDPGEQPAVQEEVEERLGELEERLEVSVFSRAVSEIPSIPGGVLDSESVDPLIGDLGNRARLVGDYYRSQRNRGFFLSVVLGGLAVLSILLFTALTVYIRFFNIHFYRQVLLGVHRLERILSYEPPGDGPAAPQWEEEEAYFQTIADVEGVIHREREMAEDYSAMTLEEFLPRLERLVMQQVSFDRIALAFIDRLNNVIAESALVHGGTPELEPGFVSAMDETTLGAVATRGEGRIIDDLSAHYREVHQSEATRLLLREGVQSSITIPLVFRKNCIGFLFLSSYRKNHFTPEDMREVNRIVQIHKQALYYQYLLQQVIAETSEAFVHLMEKKDNETSLHILRMARYSHIVAKAYHKINPGELSPRFLREILWFAPLHDVGKIGIPDAILLKPDRLTPEEFQTMQGHVMMGETVIQRMNRGMNRMVDMSLLDTAVDIIGSHHEKVDGSGYPRGLQGTEIPLAGRIVAAADVFDALTTRRPYKDAWTVERALGVMREDTGSHFCPQVMEAFEAALPEILDVYEKYKEV